MRVVASAAARSFIQENGGRLYVWPKASRCCGGSRLLASPRPSRRIEFARRRDAGELEVFMPAAIARVPDELHLELKRFPRRVEAYWDGCAWIP
ncbi:MAG TPA: hypothetical protein VGC78_10300 [Gaiellaceae bacterium]|jgi:hypothetical protein